MISYLPSGNLLSELVSDHRTRQVLSERTTRMMLRTLQRGVLACCVGSWRGLMVGEAPRLFFLTASQGLRRAIYCQMRLLITVACLLILSAEIKAQSVVSILGRNRERTILAMEKLDLREDPKGFGYDEKENASYTSFFGEDNAYMMRPYFNSSDICYRIIYTFPKKDILDVVSLLNKQYKKLKRDDMWSASNGHVSVFLEHNFSDEYCYVEYRLTF